MKVLVTGCSGFIGQHLIMELMKRPDVEYIVGLSRNSLCDASVYEKGRERYQFVQYGCDLTSKKDVKNVFKKYKPDVIYHLAANPLIKEASPSVTKTNVLATHYLLEHCPEGCKFLLASSAAVYGNLGLNHRCNEQTCPMPSSVYGITKLASEQLVREYSSAGKVRGTVARLVANVGTLATHGLVKDLVAKVRSDSRTLTLIGERPGSKKPYSYVKDTVTALLLLTLDRPTCGTYNAAPDDEITVESVAAIVQDTLGTNKPVEWLGEGANWKGDNRIVRVENWSLKTVGWKPVFSKSALAVAQAVRELGATS